MTKQRFKKAAWIAEQLGENLDDIYDILLGNITTPWALCRSVEILELDYDNIISKMVIK